MREAHNSCLGKRLYEPSAKITIQKNKNRKTCIYLKAKVCKTLNKVINIISESENYNSI